jgi:DNA (cytosine-5)-methyltransferase 1
MNLLQAEPKNVLRYVSVCSGIEAATVAWHPLGWKPAAFAEIDRFPSAVLAHHYPEVQNVGDFTQIKGDEFGSVDLLVGGTPCQDFSIAGLRAGMGGERGNLTLEFLRLAQRMRPRWLVWENVPGVFSSNSHVVTNYGDLREGSGDEGARRYVQHCEADESHAFACFLAGLQELGYGFAYRTLDAQHFGVPQRRRRVFVVGHLGDWRRAAAVLFERHSLSGHPAPRREAGEGFTYDVAPCIGASGRGFERTGDTRGQDCLIAGAVTSKWAKGTGGPAGDECYNLTVAHALRAEGFDASEDGTGRGTPLVPIAIQERAISENPDAGPDGAGFRDDGVAYTLESRTVPQAVAIGWSEELTASVELAGTVQRGGDGGRHEGVMTPQMAVRRLTPEECEALQGFPRGYTKITPKTTDGPRYKALGNSMAVPVMRWIGERIKLVDSLL